MTDLYGEPPIVVSREVYFSATDAALYADSWELCAKCKAARQRRCCRGVRPLDWELEVYKMLYEPTAARRYWGDYECALRKIAVVGWLSPLSASTRSERMAAMRVVIDARSKQETPLDAVVPWYRQAFGVQLRKLRQVPRR